MFAGIWTSARNVLRALGCVCYIGCAMGLCNRLMGLSIHNACRYRMGFGEGRRIHVM